MDWVDVFVGELRARAPVPNLGLVGPACEQGAKWILTHDFTHRTHAAIFGWHYPRSLPDWSSDDWITISASVPRRGARGGRESARLQRSGACVERRGPLHQLVPVTR